MSASSSTQVEEEKEKEEEEEPVRTIDIKEVMAAAAGLNDPSPANVVAAILRIYNLLMPAVSTSRRGRAGASMG